MFAETHSHLQLSYHITDRLLAAGNKIISEFHSKENNMSCASKTHVDTLLKFRSFVFLSFSVKRQLIQAGADPGYAVRRDEIRQGVWAPLKVPSGCRAEPWWSGGMKLLGFKHLDSVSVNDFEAFCDVFKCFKTCIFFAIIRQTELKDQCDLRVL